MASSKFTARQSAFIDFYVLTLNATEAAKRAGFSEKTAYSTGQRLLKNVELSTRINERIGKHADKRSDLKQKVIAGFAELAFDTNDISHRDKLKAMELLARHLGLLNDRLEIVTKPKTYIIELSNNRRIELGATIEGEIVK